MLAVSRAVQKKAALSCTKGKYEKTAWVALFILAGQLLPVQCSEVSKHLYRATSFRVSADKALLQPNGTGGTTC